MSEHLKNFGLMIPQFGVYIFNDCQIFNGTANEYEAFKNERILSEEIIQLKANDKWVDYWINKDPYGMGTQVMSLNQWFDKWKNPQKGFEFTSYPLKRGEP